MKYPNRLHELRNSKGFQQIEISKATGIAQPEYSRMERGERRIGSHINTLCKFYDVEIDDICLSNSTDHYLKPDSKFKEDLPVYGMPQKDGEGVQINKQFVSQTFRPDYLSGIKDSYACFICDEVMQPKFEYGELLYINPTLTPVVGDYVIVHLTVDGRAIGLFRKVSEVSDRQFKLQTLNPNKIESFKNIDIKAIHVISGTRIKI